MMQAFSGKPSEWNAIVSSLPGAHLLQTWEWSQVKAAYGWQPMPLIWKGNAGNQASAAAMVLKRQVLSRGFAARLCLLYAPKGPLLDFDDRALYSQVLDDLQDFARRQGAILLKIDPDVEVGRGVPGAPGASANAGGSGIESELKRRGWLFSGDQVQFRNTLWLDLRATEAQLLARMKQKTRYNIRLAEKKGVHVRAGTHADLGMLYHMYAETSIRDGFVIRPESYYRTVWETLMRSENADHPSAEPLIAEVDAEPVAAVFVFYFAGRAYYLYGMSREAHREKMPNYLLQWEAIKRARDRGCGVYDLWGAPDEFNESDSMWGVYRFKEGLGGEVVRTLGAWDYPARPFWHGVYTQVLPRLLNVMRARGKARTERALD